MVSWVTQENRRGRAIDVILNQSGANPVLPAPALTETIVAARRKGNSTSPNSYVPRPWPRHPHRGVTGAGLLRAAVLLETSQAHPHVFEPRPRPSRCCLWVMP